jgi:hypothetical protein
MVAFKVMGIEIKGIQRCNFVTNRTVTRVRTTLAHEKLQQQVTNLCNKNETSEEVYPQNTANKGIHFTLNIETLLLTARHDQSLCEPTREGLLTQWPNNQDLWVFRLCLPHMAPRI